MCVRVCVCVCLCVCVRVCVWRLAHLEKQITKLVIVDWRFVLGCCASDTSLGRLVFLAL